MILYLKSLSILLLLQLSNVEFRYTIEDYNVIKEDLNTSEIEVISFKNTDDINLDSLIHNKTFIEDVMNTSSITQFRYFFKFKINLPCDEMDLIIRIFEFYSHPHKIHHELIINSASESTLNNAKNKIQNYSSIKLDEFLASLK